MGLKSTLLNFSLNLLNRFFWNCTWWHTLKNVLKWLFWSFNQNSYYAQNGVNGVFWAQNWHFEDMFIRLFYNCTKWQASMAVLTFWGKLLLYQNRGIFGPKIEIFEIFAKSVNEVFLKLHLVIGTTMMFLDFEGKIILCLQWGKCFNS